MGGKNNINRREVLKTVGCTATGVSAINTTGTAAADDRNDNYPDTDKRVDAETYAEAGNYVYRRVQTTESDFLMRIDVDDGEVIFSEIIVDRDEKYTQAANIAGLKSQTKAEVSGGIESDSFSTVQKAPHPSQIVAGTNGVSVQEDGTIFKKVDVKEKYLGGCGNFLYNNHR